MNSISTSARFAPLVSMLALVAGSPAPAAEIDANSRIDAVVVLPDAAVVTRVVDVELPAGSSTLTFHGLPLALDPNSLRVEGVAGSNLMIGAVETRVTPARPPANHGALETKLRSLRIEREGVQGRLDALEAKKAMVIRFSQATPEKLSPDAKPLDIAQWSAAWDAVGDGLAKLGDALQAARERGRDLDEEIKSLEQERGKQPPANVASRDAVVSLDADEATRGRLSLTYHVAYAGWQPAYDARLDTSGGAKASLQLTRRATITQQTGEDWSGVSLSVSTVRARGGAQAPEVFTQRLAFREPTNALADATTTNAPASAASARRDLQNEKSLDKLVSGLAGALAAKEVAAKDEEATLDAGAYQATFRVPGRVDIPSDGSVKGFRISTSRSSPDLVVKAAPAIIETAYLQAHLVNNEEAPLLPGPVNILRDGTFVGVSRIGLVAPGDAADVGFGADDSVKISRVPVQRKENDPSWFGSSKVEQREFKTTVKNLHAFPVRMDVVDQIPISENSAIVIDSLPSTTPPTQKTVDDRRGVMGWSFDLAPSETKSLTLAYQMKWPADRDLVMETVPSGPRMR
jgi:uncharacterized protein (TIGR02231 family)